MRRKVFFVAPIVGSVLGFTLVVVPTVRPPSTTPPPVRMSSQMISATDHAVSAGWSKVVTGDTDLVGVRWQGDPGATFTIEKRDHQGRWTRADAVGAPDGGPDRGSAEARRRNPAAIVSEPVWLGNATAVRVRVARGTPRAVDIQKVQVPRPSSANVAAAAAPQPGIISRAQWGADESLRLTNCPEGPSYDSNVNLAIVHHTGGSNAYGPADSPAIMRGLYAYATQTLQYCDMHYNFLVDQFGQIFEGRYGGIARPVHGAHSVGWNTDTTGIATIGNFQTATPPAAMVASLERLIAWKFDVHGVDPTTPITYVTAGNDRFAPGTAVTVPRIIGHQDTWFTDCPGQYLEPLLGQIRLVVTSLMARNRGWTSWESLGGSLQSAPASASWATNRLDVFDVDGGGSLIHKWWDGAAWSSGWEDLSEPSGGMIGGPAAVSWGPDRIDVFARGGGSLRHRWWDGTRWNAWEDLGGQLTSAPAVASWGPNHLDIFARAANGTLQYKTWNGQWSGWTSLGGGVVGDPAAVSWGPGRIDVFVRGTDNRLYHQWYTGHWASWEQLGGTLSAGPTAASWQANRIDVFVRGTDRGLYHRWWNGTQWLGFEALGGGLAANPSAVSKSWNRVDVFVRGTDNQLWHRVWG